MRQTIMVLAAILGISSGASAVDGYAVSAHWKGSNANLYGGFGEIVGNAIKGSKVISSKQLYAGPARYATISSDGKMVAFIKSTGMIAFVTLGSDKVIDLVSGSSKGYLDWPRGNWLYYSKGGYGEAGSKEIWKVNVETKATAKVASFNTTMWDWGVALDGVKACVRPCDGQDGSGTGHVYRYLLNSPVTLKQGIADDIGLGCGNGISPSGAKLMRFDTYEHNSIAIQNWDKSLAKKITISQVNSWGKNMGSGWNRNRWSSNSEEWICTMQGWDGRAANQGSNQVLYNWKDSVQLPVTSYASGKQEQVESGDFWVGSPTIAVADNMGRHSPAQVRPSSSSVYVSLGTAGQLRSDQVGYDATGRRFHNLSNRVTSLRLTKDSGK